MAGHGRPASPRLRRGIVAICRGGPVGTCRATIRPWRSPARPCPWLTASAGSPTPSGTSWSKRRRWRPPARTVRYLNIGDPISVRLPHPAPPGRGHRQGDARRSQRLHRVARHLSRRARPRPPISPRAGPDDRSPIACCITSGTSEGIELTLTALRQRRRRGARADADLSALYGGARQDRRQPRATTAPIRRAAGCRTSITWRGWSRRGRARSW